MTEYVLIVDDDPDALTLVRDILDSLEVEGREALNGQIALQMARTDPPAALVLDLVMPGLNGYTILQEIRQDPVLNATPVIVLSAYVDEDEHWLREEPGVVDVLSKGRPSADRLRALLLQALGRA